MAKNDLELEYSAGFMGVLTSSEAPVRKREALKEYIGQIEARLKVTDPALYPRYRARLQNELNIAIEEFKTVTESN